jgi:hypothetical protein
MISGCVNGYCNNSLECKCNPGWHGMLCDKRQLIFLLLFFIVVIIVYVLVAVVFIILVFVVVVNLKAVNFSNFFSAWLSVSVSLSLLKSL